MTKMIIKQNKKKTKQNKSPKEATVHITKRSYVPSKYVCNRIMQVMTTHVQGGSLYCKMSSSIVFSAS